MKYFGHYLTFLAQQSRLSALRIRKKIKYQVGTREPFNFCECLYRSVAVYIKKTTFTQMEVHQIAFSKP